MVARCGCRVECVSSFTRSTSACRGPAVHTPSMSYSLHWYEENHPSSCRKWVNSAPSAPCTPVFHLRCTHPSNPMDCAPGSRPVGRAAIESTAGTTPGRRHCTAFVAGCEHAHAPPAPRCGICEEPCHPEPLTPMPRAEPRQWPARPPRRCQRAIHQGPYLSKDRLGRLTRFVRGPATGNQAVRPNIRRGQSNPVSSYGRAAAVGGVGSKWRGADGAMANACFLGKNRPESNLDSCQFFELRGLAQLVRARVV